MYYTLNAAARLYRVTSTNTNWHRPLLGQGAHFTHGGRYNRVSQATVYCSEDPLVAITEQAFYQALDWHRAISFQRKNPMTYPLISRHTLWCFSIDPPPPLIDLEHQQAMDTFQYSPHFLHNPSLNPRPGVQTLFQNPARDYTGTQELADDVRSYSPPPGVNQPRPEGVKFPSTRMPRKYKFQPCNLALFIKDADLQVPYHERSDLIDQWELTIEFLELRSGQPVTFQTREIDWERPRFQIGPVGGNVIPAYIRRPRSAAINPDQWCELDVCYT
jgi:RES domain